MKNSLLVAPVLLALAFPAMAADPATAPKPAAAKPAPAKPAPAKPAAGKTATPPAEGQATAREIPEDVRAEMSAFVEKAIQLAAPELEATGVFIPYGVFQKKNGEIKSMRWDKKKGTPQVGPLLAEMLRRLRVMAKDDPEVVLAATVASASVPTVEGKDRVNGIRVEVDHRRGEPRVVFIPYTRENGRLVLGTLVYMGGSNPVFNWKEPAAAAPAPAAAGTPAASSAPAAPAAKPAAPAAK